MPYFSPLIGGFLERQTGFDIMSGYMEFVLDKVALWQVISKYEIIGDHQCQFQHNKSIRITPPPPFFGYWRKK
jgi:hypothetical protein